MDWSAAAKDWQQYKSKVKGRWPNLNYEQLNRIDGRRDDLLDQLQAVYDMPRDEAERQVARFERNNDNDTLHTPKTGNSLANRR